MSPRLTSAWSWLLLLLLIKRRDRCDHWVTHTFLAQSIRRLAMAHHGFCRHGLIDWSWITNSSHRGMAHRSQSIGTSQKSHFCQISLLQHNLWKKQQLIKNSPEKKTYVNRIQIQRRWRWKKKRSNESFDDRMNDGMAMAIATILLWSARSLTHAVHVQSFNNGHTSIYSSNNSDNRTPLTVRKSIIVRSHNRHDYINSHFNHQIWYIIIIIISNMLSFFSFLRKKNTKQKQKFRQILLSSEVCHCH